MVRGLLPKGVLHVVPEEYGMIYDSSGSSDKGPSVVRSRVAYGRSETATVS
jgi:hypothetical protein